VTSVAAAVGAALSAAGVDRVFGVVGSGNFHVTNAMIAAGSTFVAARHENGAATMADAYARMSGRVSAVSVHQGCGLTNAMTGIAEAAKSSTPMVVLAAEVTQPRSNFYVDQAALAVSVGAVPARITDPATAVAEAEAAVALARDQRRTVVLNLPLQLQAEEVPDPPPAGAAGGVAGGTPSSAPAPRSASGAELDLLVAALRTARRPVFVAGRGSRGPGCRDALQALA
jgi:acetolactate synthase-1/2/3 large subunit